MIIIVRSIVETIGISLATLYFKLRMLLNGIKVRAFFEKKNIDKKHLCRHDKNHYYFCKSNIPVVNLIVGSTNMIKVSKNTNL